MAPQTRPLTVQIGQTHVLDFQLGAAATQLTAVQVVAAPVATETRTSEVGTNISREQIENLPTADRNFLDFAKLAPGMTASQPNSEDKTLSAGGRPPEGVNVFVD